LLASADRSCPSPRKLTVHLSLFTRMVPTSGTIKLVRMLALLFLTVPNLRSRRETRSTCPSQSQEVSHPRAVSPHLPRTLARLSPLPPRPPRLTRIKRWSLGRRTCREPHNVRLFSLRRRPPRTLLLKEMASTATTITGARRKELPSQALLSLKSRPRSVEICKHRWLWLEANTTDQTLFTKRVFP